MSDRTPLDQVTDRPEPQVVSEAASTSIEEETSPNIAGQTPPTGELAYFTDMRDLSIQLGFEDNSFDGMGKEADTVYSWAKKETGVNGGPEVIFRIKVLKDMLGIPSRGKDLLRRLSQWTRIDNEVRTLNLRKMSI